MKSLAPTSLSQYFRRQATRSAIAGACFSVVLSLVLTIYFEKASIESRVANSAAAASNAFREAVLDGGIRKVQYQMREVLELKPDESALVLNNSQNVIYPMVEALPTQGCEKPETPCWGKGFHSVTYLQPIYFNDKKDSTFGYLQLRMNPKIDYTVLAIIFLSIIFIFAIQAFGLITGLSQGGKIIRERLAAWANHLRNLKATDEHRPVPFLELQEVQTEFDGLHSKLETLEAEAAEQAQSAAQLSIIKQISHDLKTPISQLSNYWLAHTHALKHLAILSYPGFFVKNIKRTIDRMDDIAKQVEDLNSDLKAVDEKDLNCDLAVEAKDVVEEIGDLDEIVEKNIKIEIHGLKDIQRARVSSIGLYRILVNLIRNSVKAVSPQKGKIVVSIYEGDGGPILSVKDNGAGIPKHILEQIFRWDFSTTKGAGLGLGMVKQICDRVEAEIEVKTELEIGSEFIVKFKPSRVKESLYEVQDLSC